MAKFFIDIHFWEPYFIKPNFFNGAVVKLFFHYKEFFLLKCKVGSPAAYGFNAAACLMWTVKWLREGWLYSWLALMMWQTDPSFSPGLWGNLFLYVGHAYMFW